jgi:MFS transporter, ACS family, aldohexuronate transporter
MGLSAALMPFVMFIPYVPVSWAILIFSLAYFGQQSWSTLVMVLPTDLFPARVVGSVAGLIDCGGAMGGIALGEIVGYSAQPLENKTNMVLIPLYRICSRRCRLGRDK